MCQVPFGNGKASGIRVEDVSRLRSGRTELQSLLVRRDDRGLISHSRALGLGIGLEASLLTKPLISELLLRKG